MSLLFSFPAYEFAAQYLIQELDWKRGEFHLERFSNLEWHLTLGTSVTGAVCYLLGSIAPPDSNLLALIALSHTLKKEGALQCIAILPYLAYTRHEHVEKGKSQMTALVGKILASSGIDRVITVDVHSPKVQELFPIPILSLSPSGLFADTLCQTGFYPDIIVAPDFGAKERCQWMERALHAHTQVPVPVVYMEKQRRGKEIIHEKEMDGSGKKILILDDILDTGGTLLSCIQKISSPREIIIMASHGIFTGDLWKKLFDAGVKNIYFLDSVYPIPPGLDVYPIHKISVYPLIKEHLCNLPAISP